MRRAVFGWLFACATVCRAGDIEGFVKFPGESPPPQMIANAADAACPSGIGATHLIVHQENRGLKNALVVVEYQEDVPHTHAAPIGLKSQGCVFSPRVQWTMSPASLTITNLDDTQQDVRGSIDGVRAFAIDVDGRGTSVRRPLARAKLYRIDSDRHPWMRAYIYVSENPYVAVTDGDGHFAIRDVPPGTWTIRAWHEGWEQKGKDRIGRIEFQPEEQTRKVHVPDEGHVEVMFEGLAPTF